MSRLQPRGPGRRTAEGAYKRSRTLSGRSDASVLRLLRRDRVAFEEAGKPCRSVSRVSEVEQMAGSGHHVVLGLR
jgi:hypothetical protein